MANLTEREQYYLAMFFEALHADDEDGGKAARATFLKCLEDNLEFFIDILAMDVSDITDDTMEMSVYDFMYFGDTMIELIDEINKDLLVYIGDAFQKDYAEHIKYDKKAKNVVRLGAKKDETD